MRWVKSAITHSVTNLRGKNNIDWRPRGLWITYRGNFILTYADASMLSCLCQDNNGIFECLENIFFLTCVWVLAYSALCWLMPGNTSGQSIVVSTITFYPQISMTRQYEFYLFFTVQQWSCHILSAGILHGCWSNQYQLSHYFCPTFKHHLMTSQIFP